MLMPTIALAAAPETSQSVTVVVPEDFQYQGKPISPLCILRIANGESNKAATVNLSNCTQNEKKYKLEPDQSMIEKGFIGYDYTKKNSKEAYAATESAYYKYLGKFKNFHVIYFISSGGGSGTFTSVFLLDRKGNNIKYAKNIIPVGDRCNGGIETVSLKDGKLNYSLHITPYNYIELSGIKLPDIKAYDGLSACAACCQGTAQFESDFENSQLVSINIGDSFENSQGVYQDCFNSVLKDYKAHAKQTLSVKEIKDFVRKFQNMCLRKQ